MPDVVCAGAVKHYWVDPNPGSAYTWKINGVVQPSTTNEIIITWDNTYPPSGSPYTYAWSAGAGRMTIGLLAVPVQPWELV